MEFLIHLNKIMQDILGSRSIQQSRSTVGSVITLSHGYHCLGHTSRVFYSCHPGKFGIDQRPQPMSGIKIKNQTTHAVSLDRQSVNR